ncbi:MAG: hypothetical protein KatS3mg121_0577 [Gammaproteobacteria bacterium]|nr:MAG: hypothetical protein KatS3mg121_0577 [Gammaproteobacteria bacterium]
MPVAVLSLRQEGNDLKTRAAEVYLPAFIRRYPFALSDDGVVVFDRKSVFIGEDPEGRPLFNDDGSNSKLLDDILRFLYFMDEQYKRTREFCQALAEAEMLVPFNATVRLGQERNLRMDSLWMIDQKKLDALDDGKVVEFYRKGWLAWAIAHLASIGALARLAQRQSRAGEAAQTGAA